jgi:hypothetical protein
MKPQLASLVGKRVHFIGIGGAGMSGLARIALSHGITVSGSDAKDSSVVTALAALGATVSTSHRAENVDGSDLVVYSNAISESNSERLRAKELSLPVLTRAGALSVLMSESKSVAVAGTHGKTTTSSMLAVALQACGRILPLQSVELSPLRDRMRTAELVKSLLQKQMNPTAPLSNTTRLLPSSQMWNTTMSISLKLQNLLRKPFEILQQLFKPGDFLLTAQMMPVRLHLLMLSLLSN